MTILYFILILGSTILIHELGHFMFAKLFKVHVYEFSIGMGPRLFKFNRKNDETTYSIRLFPIGGYVQMAGEELEVDSKIPKDRILSNKPAYQRFLIMVAGVMMNFLLSIVLLFFLGLFNTVSLNNVYVTESTVSGLNENAKIISVDGRFVNNYDKLNLELTVSGSKDFQITVLDNNEKKNITIHPIAVGESNLINKINYGFKVSDLTITESSVTGLSVNDKIIGINDKKINDYSTLLSILNDIKVSNFSLVTMDSSGNTHSVLITPSEDKKDNLLGYHYGFYIKGNEEKGLLAAIKYSFLKFYSTIEQMVFTFIYLFTGKISVSMLSGPIGIYNVVDVYSHYGFSNIISLLCLICINVGFINILPLPAFDGGHIVFIIIEKIIGKKVDPKVENTIHNIGFILLMILMILVTYNDIIKLF